MHKIKSPALLLMAILIGGVLTNATAQRRLPPAIEPPSPIQPLSGTYKIDVSANELSAGEVDFSGTTNGWTSYGVTAGEMSGYIFFSMSYSAPTALEFGGEVKQVTGGSWSKLIFIKGVYAGSINGRIISGELVSGTGVVGELVAPMTISLELAGDGGTEAFADSVGSGTFVGVMDYGHKGSNVYGTLSLTY